MGISILYVYTCVYNSKDISINKEKEICILNKESIGGQRCERVYMGTNVRCL